jgi:hypothetical protein
MYEENNRIESESEKGNRVQNMRSGWKKRFDTRHPAFRMALEHLRQRKSNGTE